MGLDASVRCNCIKEGKALPHPFPELLAVDETGEPTLRKEGEISLDQWAAQDKWYRKSCSHSGCLVDRHLGNIGLVAHFRELLRRNSPNNFPCCSNAWSIAVLTAATGSLPVTFHNC
jgi:hypothetical protein